MLKILLTLDVIIGQCVAVDAVVETDLVSALQVSAFPEMIFTKAGKILYREKGDVLGDPTITLVYILSLP